MLIHNLNQESYLKNFSTNDVRTNDSVLTECFRSLVLFEDD